MNYLVLFFAIWAVSGANKLDDEIEKSDSLKGGQFSEVRKLMGRFSQKSRRKLGLSDDPKAAMNQVIPKVYNDGTELAANKDILTEMFENDMVLTVNQMQSLLSNLDNKRRKKRKVTKSDIYEYLWKSVTIPYKFSGVDRDLKYYIRNGLKHWEEKTCLRFVEDGSGDDFISFIRGSGCYSNVGRVGGRQVVSIGPGCETLGIVAHEIGHALGFWHEQSRPDRDKYIRVNFENIFTGTEYNFEKRSIKDVTYHGLPYDHGSAMHYSAKSFAKDWSKTTIDTVDKNYKNTIGQRSGLSFIDIKQINRAYCSDACDNSRDCKHGGYPNPNNCDECLCAEGLNGECDRVAASSSGNCGGDLTATPEWQNITLSEIIASQHCNWRIKAPLNGKIVFEFTTLDFQCLATCTSYVEVKYNADFQQTGPRFCCEPPSRIESQQPELLIMYRTTSYFAHWHYKGFAARYKIEGVIEGWQFFDSSNFSFGSVCLILLLLTCILVAGYIFYYRSRYEVWIPKELFHQYVAPRFKPFNNDSNSSKLPYTKRNILPSDISAPSNRSVLKPQRPAPTPPYPRSPMVNSNMSAIKPMRPQNPKWPEVKASFDRKPLPPPPSNPKSGLVTELAAKFESEKVKTVKTDNTKGKVNALAAKFEGNKGIRNIL